MAPIMRLTLASALMVGASAFTSVMPRLQSRVGVLSPTGAMSKDQVDEYIATVKAGVDFVAKAREARSKPLTAEQIAAYGDFPPYGTRAWRGK